MYIIASFEHSISLELALTELEAKGIGQESILAIPLTPNRVKTNVIDSIHHADGISKIDCGFALGSALMVIGAIYGFVLKWGPIIWGLIGLITGFAIGYFLDNYRTMYKNMKNNKKRRSSEVVVMVNCNLNSYEIVEDIFWNNFALGVARLDKDK